MKEKILKCKKCWYAFPVGNLEVGKKITCPYCKVEGNETEFEDMPQEKYGTGYKKSLDEFKYVLRESSKHIIKAFFKRNIKVFSVKIKDKEYIFKDADGLERSFEEIHFYIQNNIVLQRMFFDIWADL